MTAEGGFNGRANKLVDSCYSFWQGASLVILRDLFVFAGLPVPSAPGNLYWFNHEGLSKYVVSACQCENGGLRDKPGKSPDYYHSCYALSGLAVTQVGEGGLNRTHALYNIRPERIWKFQESLNKLPVLGFSGHF
jgi:protein farnesyltransferase subunit beta